MKWRVAAAVAFVAVVGALIVLRDHGYLGGRESGGPFAIHTAGVTSTARLDEVRGFGIDGQLKGKPIDIQNVRVRIASPELKVLGPNLSLSRCGACPIPHWPPLASRPLEGAHLDVASPRALIGLRAERPGLYYALGLITDYRRGQRRYRDREAQLLCISVHTQQQCNGAYAGPGAARVAQVGGPSRYPGARFSVTSATYKAPGDYAIRMTISNRTRSAIDVAKIALDANGLGATIASDPAAFHLAPHGFQTVRLQLTATKCTTGGVATLSRLRADLDKAKRSIPLSLPIVMRCDG
jgi:hypothetical protein